MAMNEPMANDNVSDSFTRLLLTDVSMAVERYAAAQSQAARRDLIRCTFAAIEGLTWLSREIVVEIASQLDVLTDAERSALAATTVHVNAAGKVVEQARFIPLLNTIRLVAAGF